MMLGPCRIEPSGFGWPMEAASWGMWTGEKWWSVKGEINPVNWELEERPKKTKKLEKALRESEEGYPEEGEA